jgi:small conductance mechanosensitive channel
MVHAFELAVAQIVPDWIQRIGPRWLAVVGILVLGWYGSKLLVRILRPAVRRRIRRTSVVDVILRVVRAGLMIAVVFTAAGIVGFRPGNILLSATVLAAAVGVVLAPILEDLIDGLFILANRPYDIGDMVELVEQEQVGYIEDITLRYTKVFTLDNSSLLLPNRTMRERDLINYSSEDERTRRSLELLVTYEGDLDDARALMERAARETEEVIEGGPEIRIGSMHYPAGPEAYIKEFADHGVLLELRFWVKAPYYPVIVSSKVREKIWDGLEDVDVSIPYPHSHLVFDETSGQAQVAVETEPTDAAGIRSSSD